MSTFTMALLGVGELKRKFQLANPIARQNFKAAIKKNTEALAAKAKSSAPRKTGELASTVRAEYSEDELTGFVRAGYGRLLRRNRARKAVTAGQARRQRKLRQRAIARRTGQFAQGIYAPVVERGDPRRHHKPHPYLIPAFQSQRDTARRDMKAALDNTVKTI